MHGSDDGMRPKAAGLASGFGMSFRKNFVHHSLEVPGLHGRGGIYFDDHQSAISNASGNVLYVLMLCTLLTTPGPPVV